MKCDLCDSDVLCSVGRARSRPRSCNVCGCGILVGRCYGGFEAWCYCTFGPTAKTREGAEFAWREARDTCARCGNDLEHVAEKGGWIVGCTCTEGDWRADQADALKAHRHALKAALPESPVPSTPTCAPPLTPLEALRRLRAGCAEEEAERLFLIVAEELEVARLVKSELARLCL